MPRQKLIVYTRPDSGVSICAPSMTALNYMTSGGGRWDGYDPGFLSRQIEAHSKDGVGEWSAKAFVHAMQFGGLTDAEAYGVMRDRFCAHLGTGCELVERDELMLDRWFRDAWRRSRNGGPIYVAMRAARKIQMRKIEALKIDINVNLWRSRIRRASTPSELKMVFPRIKAEAA